MTLESEEISGTICTEIDQTYSGLNRGRKSWEAQQARVNLRKPSLHISAHDTTNDSRIEMAPAVKNFYLSGQAIDI